MKTTFIYALNDPVTGRTRYIGKADNPLKRFSVHLADKGCNYRTNWVQSLVAKGLKPVLEILDEVPDCEWPSWEVAYIQFFRESGFELTNFTMGGEGLSGAVLTPEHRAKISAAHTGKTVAPEHLAKLQQGNIGRKHSPEEIEKRISKIRGPLNCNFGKSLTDEQKERLRIANLGKKQSPETIAKRVAACTGKKRSLESREKMAAAARLRKHSSETCAKISAIQLGHKATEETRRRMSEAHRVWHAKRKLLRISEGMLIS